jgi:hypothetical protein
MHRDSFGASQSFLQLLIFQLCQLVLELVLVDIDPQVVWGADSLADLVRDFHLFPDGIHLCVDILDVAAGNENGNKRPSLSMVMEQTRRGWSSQFPMDPFHGI